MKVKIPVILLLALTLVGCATIQHNAHPGLLQFLNDGRTTKEEAILKLGQPSGKFEGEKIFTYRIGFDSHNNGYYLAERPPNLETGITYTTWWNTRFSLVLVFDEHDVLREHSLVEVTK